MKIENFVLLYAMTLLEFFLLLLFIILHIILMVIGYMLNLINKKVHLKFYNNIIKKYFSIFIYVFIIFSTMLPNKNNTSNLHELNSIIPGINKLYTNNLEQNINKEYSFKLFEILQNILWLL